MSIKLFSGLPGSGKTLSLVATLVEFREKSQKEHAAARPVYAYGIAGLKGGLALPVDPQKPPIKNPAFGEVDEPEFLPWWAQLPHGSIICIDEVQDLWPDNRLKGDELQKRQLDIFMLTKHRHWGYDFLLTSQKPKFIHEHARELVDEHVHIVRKWKAATVDRYIWQECQKNVQSRTVRALGQRQRWKYPKACYPLYQSSTVHTMKRKMPWQYWAMIGAAVLAVPLIWYAVHRVIGLRHIVQDSGAAPKVAGAVPGGPVGRGQAGYFNAEKTRWATPEDYVRDHLPRVANQPWSAPVFDQEPIRAQPDLMCVEMGQPATPTHAAWTKCTCYTEQVTPYDIGSLEECRRYARDGVYNPRRPPIGGDRFAREDRAGSSRRAPAGAAAQADGPAGDAGAWPASDSALRTPYVPPELSRTTH